MKLLQIAFIVGLTLFSQQSKSEPHSQREVLSSKPLVCSNPEPLSEEYADIVRSGIGLFLPNLSIKTSVIPNDDPRRVVAQHEMIDGKKGLHFYFTRAALKEIIPMSAEEYDLLQPGKHSFRWSPETSQSIVKLLFESK